MPYNDKQVLAGVEYIRRWLECSGYSPRKWDGQSQDGNWLLYAITEADGARCVCCQEPILQNAPQFLRASCGWLPLHFEALEFVTNGVASK